MAKYKIEDRAEEMLTIIKHGFNCKDNASALLNAIILYKKLAVCKMNGEKEVIVDLRKH